MYKKFLKLKKLDFFSKSFKPKNSSEFLKKLSGQKEISTFFKLVYSNLNNEQKICLPFLLYI